MIEFALIGNLTVTILTGMASCCKYFSNKKTEQKQKEFELFHKLIKELVQPEPGCEMYLDRQTAIIFELRNFERYQEYSLRMLKGLRKVPEWEKEKRLIEEIDVAISFIEKKLEEEKKNWLRKKVGL